MGKQMTHVAKLEQELAQARQSEAQAVEQAEVIREKYRAAVDSGDMEAAHQHRTEAERLEGVAQMHKDRVQTLEGKRGDAEAKDAEPAYKAAMKDAEAAIQAEAEAHRKVADLIHQLAEARRELDSVHSAAGTAIMQAHRAADAADQPLPEFRDRSRMASVTDVDTLYKTTRELANVAADQSQKMMATSEAARKKAA